MNSTPTSFHRERLINPSRLKDARESKGLTMADLARLLDLSRQAVSSFEKGTKSPSADTLQLICRVLNFPERFFTAKNPLPPIDGVVHFRRRSSALKAEQMQARVRGREVVHLVKEMSHFATPPEPKIPKLIPDDPERLTDASIEEIATQTRRYWRLGDGPIINLTRLLENNGIVIGLIPISVKVDAFSFWSEDKPIVATDNQATAVRHRFNLAHELGHLIMHRYLSEEELKDKFFFQKIERQANYFAACFLMPATSFGQEYYSPSLAALKTLKQRWLVSIAAMSMRAENLGLMSETQKQYLFRQLAAYQKKEPLDDSIVKEEPQLIHKLAKFLDKNGLLKIHDLADASTLPLSDLTVITNLSKAELLYEKGNLIPFKRKVTSDTIKN